MGLEVYISQHVYLVLPPEPQRNSSSHGYFGTFRIHYSGGWQYYTAVQNLIYGCGNVSQTTAECSDTPRIHCDQHVQQFVDMSIQFPAGLQCDPVQMAQVVQLEYLLFGGTWSYPRVNAALFTSQSTAVTAYGQNRGRKDRPP